MADLNTRDTLYTALRINRQDLPEMIRGCRWVIARGKNRPDVFADYLRVLRMFNEQCERAEAMGIGGKLTEALAPLPIWNDEYRWEDVLERVCPPLSIARAA
jgi:hypothetical protein